jgi:hypothetical protein
MTEVSWEWLVVINNSVNVINDTVTLKIAKMELDMMVHASNLCQGSRIASFKNVYIFKMGSWG